VDARPPILPDGKSQAHRNLSAGVSFGRFTERSRTPTWWRSARISNWSAARLRNDAESEVMSAASTGPKGNLTMCDKSQFISQIGIYEMHNLRVLQPFDRRVQYYRPGLAGG
jgi:hypothetical protein